MKFKQLLYVLRHGILHDQSNQEAGAEFSDFLWSDELLTIYMNEAHRRFAVGSLCLREYKNPEVCSFMLQPYQKEYALHPSITAVISARLEGAKMDLARAGHSQFDTYRQPDNYFFNTNELQQFPPGAVVAFDTDEGMTDDDWGSLSVVNFRAYPSPKPEYIRRVWLRVVRRPTIEFSMDQPDLVPQIPPDHHMDMLDWAAYLALRIVDRDGGDPERAAEYQAQFEKHVKEARLIAMRKMFTPMQWGFGRNGFSYERDGDGG